MVKRWWAVLLAAALLVTASGCGWDQKNGSQDYAPGETVSTYWFDFTLETVETVDSYDGYRPASGNRLIVCHLLLVNTFDEAITMSQTDFFLLWPDDSGDTSAALEGMTGAYALPKFSNRQLPDEYELPLWATQEGDLVFEVPQAVTSGALAFEEYYVDGESETGYSIGDHYAVRFSLESDGPSPS